MNKKILTTCVMLVIFLSLFCGCEEIDLGEVTQFSIQYFTCEPQIIQKGEYTNLSWIVTSAQNVNINNGVGSVSNSGKQIVMPEETTTYILTATNKSVTITASTTVIVVNKSTTETIKIPYVNFSKDETSKTLTITDVSDSILWSDIDIINAELSSNSNYVSIGDIISNCNNIVIITYKQTTLLGVWNFVDSSDEEDHIISIGDCADIQYTAMFKSNGTVFDTTYESIAKKWGIYTDSIEYEAIEVFVDPNGNLKTPDGFESYTSSVITGVLNALIGMKKGEKRLVTIYPDDAYGGWDEELAESYGLSPYPIESPVDIKWDMGRSLFTQYFSGVNQIVNTTFDWGSVMLGIDDTIFATISQVNQTNVTYLVKPEDNLTFTMPLFDWSVRLLVTNNDYFILRTETYIGFETQIDFGENQVLNLMVTDMNNTDLRLAINQNALDIKLIDQVLMYEIEVINTYETSEE